MRGGAVVGGGGPRRGDLHHAPALPPSGHQLRCPRRRVGEAREPIPIHAGARASAPPRPPQGRRRGNPPSPAWALLCPSSRPRPPWSPPGGSPGPELRRRRSSRKGEQSCPRGPHGGSSLGLRGGNRAELIPLAAGSKTRCSVAAARIATRIAAHCHASWHVRHARAGGASP